MAYVLKSIYDFTHFYLLEYSDPRTTNMPLIGSPIPILLLLGSYLYFIYVVGPRWMSYRNPYQIKGIMLTYNLLQMVANITMLVYGTYWSYWQSDYSIRCAVSPYRPTQRAQHEANGTYAYFLLKILDLLDTIFFVLRKRNSHITFLHVYHHTNMVIITYIATKFIPAGHASMLGLINSFVHTVMYGYYFLSIINKEFSQMNWCKRTVTQIQLAQFTLLAIHFFQAFFNVNCEYPRAISLLLGIQNIFMMIMFGDFYIRTYDKKRKHI